MTGDDVTWIDYDPHRVHLPTNAPHVHVRGTDKCLRSPGEPCLSGEALRARVRELEAEVEIIGRTSKGNADAHMREVQRRGAAEARAESAEAERDEYRAMVEDVTAERDRIRDEAAAHARRRTAEGLRERNRADALQQQVANVRAVADDRKRHLFVAEERRGFSVTRYDNPLMPVSDVLAALDGPAAPLSDLTEVGTTDETAEADRPQEPHPTPEAGA